MKVNNEITSYDKMLYESGPVKVSDFISSNFNKIHQELFEDAMSKFYEEHPEFNSSNVRVIEIKAKEYWMPSTIRLIDYSSQPKKYCTYVLDNYWNNVYVEKKDSKVTEQNLDDKSQIDYLDFVQGTATMKGRYSQCEYKVEFDKLASDVEVSDNYDVYKTTFISKMKGGN